jgi:AcrR family transcriptional regulator
MRQVARDLGVAPSLISYFFASWSELIAAAYRMLAERFGAEQREIAERPGLDPAERLEALIDHYFSDYWSSDDVAGAYIAFWALTRSEVDLRGEMSRFSASMRDALAPHLEVLAAERGIARDMGPVADMLAVLLSGLWYEMAVNPQAMPAAQAREMVRAWLASETEPARPRGRAGIAPPGKG